MIRRVIPTFLRRISDFVLPGRNSSMIVIGTDRKDVANSGYGDGGKNKTESSMIDLVAGYKKQNPDYKDDASRVLISECTDPDEYFGINKGSEQKSTPSVVISSDQVYLKARKNIKIVNDNFSIIVNESGEVEISTTSSGKIKCGSSVITLKSNGEILLGGEGPGKRILTEDDRCFGTVVGGAGGTVISDFKTPPAIIGNQKIKIS